MMKISFTQLNGSVWGAWWLHDSGPSVSSTTFGDEQVRSIPSKGVNLTPLGSRYKVTDSLLESIWPRLSFRRHAALATTTTWQTSLLGPNFPRQCRLPSGSSSLGDALRATAINFTTFGAPPSPSNPEFFFFEKNYKIPLLALFASPVDQIQPLPMRCKTFLSSFRTNFISFIPFFFILLPFNAAYFYSEMQIVIFSKGFRRFSLIKLLITKQTCK